MERGKLGVENRQVTVFVFEDLIGHLARPRMEKINLRLGRWAAALDAWDLDLTVCDYVTRLIGMNVPVDVITWRPPGFATALHDLLWYHDVPVRDVHAGTYRTLSQHFSINTEVTAVFDPDPAHRLGYGFKCREFHG